MTDAADHLRDAAAKLNVVLPDDAPEIRKAKHTAERKRQRRYRFLAVAELFAHFVVPFIAIAALVIALIR